MTDVYITYSIRERFWVSKLVSALESEGYSVWWDHAVIPGKEIRGESQRELIQAKCALVIWSETAVDDHWVLLDSQQANQQETLVSVLARECDIPLLYQPLETIDMKDWKLGSEQDKYFKNLLGKIKAYCQPSQLPQRVKEQRTKSRLERIRAERERKQKDSALSEARMARKRMSFELNSFQ